MAKRKVTIDLRNLTDAPWAEGDKVKFILQRNNFSASATYLAGAVEAEVDEEGRASIDLWCNAEGVKPSQYICELPTFEKFPFALPPGDGAVSVEVLRGLSATPYTASNEALFQALIDAHAEVEANARAAADSLYTLTVDADTVLAVGAALRALILIDTTAGDVTVTLPPLAEMAGRKVVCKLIAGGNLGIIDADGSETIDGQLVVNLEVQYQRVRLMPGPTEWCLV